MECMVSLYTSHIVVMLIKEHRLHMVFSVHPGIVSNDGQYPPASGLQMGFLCTGPMCRYAEDLIPMLSIMGGPNANK